MKSNKGFTLIELLAVIVILAVIALIAMPLIMNVIDDARKGAERSSAYAYIHALEQDIVLKEALGLTSYDANCMKTGSTCTYTRTSAQLATESLVKTSKPKAVSFTISNRIVTAGEITVGDYTFTVTNGQLADKAN